MKPEALPHFSILAVLILAAIWAWNTWDRIDFNEADGLQFMEPQIIKDETRTGKRTAHRDLADIEPGHIVRYKTKRTGNWTLSARVVALEGDRVKIEEGTLYVNGDEFKDDYKRGGAHADYFPEIIVPSGCLFVVNDTRWGKGADRFDSRTIGPIPYRSVTHTFSPREKRAKRKGFNRR